MVVVVVMMVVMVVVAHTRISGGGVARVRVRCHPLTTTATATRWLLRAQGMMMEEVGEVGEDECHHS